MEERVETALEDHFTYKMSFTLWHLSAASVVAALWSNGQIRVAITNGLRRRPTFCKKTLRRKRIMRWKNIEKKVSKNAAKLHASKRDLKFLLYLIKRMGGELFNWIWFIYKYLINIHRGIFGLIFDVYATLDHLDVVWTCMGQVDYRKTAMRLFRFGDLDVNLRFQLACNFCLEKDIRELWDENPSGIFSKEDVLVKFWISELTGNFNDLEKVVKSSNDEQNLDHNGKAFVFYWALKQNNKTAVRYMWDNYCTEFNDRKSFRKAIHEAACVFNINFICHLLTQADQAEKEDSFRYSHEEILKCLLENSWSESYLWADHYLPTLRRVKKFMDPTSFDIALEDVAKWIGESREGYKCSYRDLFKVLWQYCPKDQVFQLEQYLPWWDSFLCSSFRRKDKELVLLILSDVSVCIDERKKTLFSPKGIIACKNLIVYKEWDLLDMFLERAFESEKDFKKFKGELKAEEGANIAQYLNKDEWNWAEKFLNLSFNNGEEMIKLKLKLALENSYPTRK